MRRIIGGLFLLYGAVLMVMGIGASDVHKAAGANAYLWSGIGMLTVGVLFMAWALMRPLGKQLREAEQAERAPASQQARRFARSDGARAVREPVAGREQR